MYDARGSSGMSPQQANLIFAVVTVVVIAIAFFGVLFFPFGSSTAPSGAAIATAQSDHPILTRLSDSKTEQYIAKLETAAPESAKLLRKEAAAAIARNAGENELVMLMMSSYDEDDFRVLAKADIRHIDAISKHLTDGLHSLSRTNSKWCRASHYESMSNVDPALVISDLGRALGYKTAFYNWTLDLNMIMLNAVEDARINPKKYSGLTPSDEAVMQRAMMGLLANPQIMQLMMLQGSSPADAKRAVANVDFCELGLSLEGVYSGLPKGTRERLWGEMAKEIDGGSFGRSFGDFASF